MLTSSSRPQSVSSASAAEKFPFGHRGAGEGDVAAGVFQHQRALEKILHGADAIGDVSEGFFGQRKRQEIVGVDAQHAGPAEMVGDPTGIHFAGEAFEFGEVVEVQLVGAADRERDTVHDDGVALGNLLQHVAWAAGGIDEVFRNDFKPIDVGLMLEDVARNGRCEDRRRDRDWGG